MRREKIKSLKIYKVTDYGDQSPSLSVQTTFTSIFLPAAIENCEECHDSRPLNALSTKNKI